MPLSYGSNFEDQYLERDSHVLLNATDIAMAS